MEKSMNEANKLFVTLMDCKALVDFITLFLVLNAK